MRVEAIQVARLLLAALEATMQDHKVDLDMAVLLLAVLRLAAKAVTADQLVFQQVRDKAVMVLQLQLLTPSQLQLAALATKDPQDLQDRKDLLETQERMATTEKMEITAKTLNCSLLNQLKFASSAHKDLQDLKEHQAQRVRQDQREAQESHQRMDNQESKVNKVNQAVKEDQEEKDHEALQVNPEDSSPFQDHKELQDHKVNQESPDQRVNQAQTDNPSKDPQDCPETQAKLDAKEDLDQLDLPDPPEKPERRDLASTALHQEPLQVTRHPRTLAFDFAYCEHRPLLVTLLSSFLLLSLCFPNEMSLNPQYVHCLCL